MPTAARAASASVLPSSDANEAARQRPPASAAQTISWTRGSGERGAEDGEAGSGGGRGLPSGQGAGRHAGTTALVLGEARSAAERPLEGEEAEGEEQQEARNLGRRGSIEHAVPDTIDGLGERPVSERGDGAKICERFHHGQ